MSTAASICFYHDTPSGQFRVGLRHAVVCPNVTGRIKERIAQSKRARAGSLVLVDQPQVA